MGESSEKVEFQVKKKMRLNQIALLLLGTEGEEEEKSWKKDKKTPETAIKQAAIKIYGYNWKQLYQSSKIIYPLTLCTKKVQRNKKWTRINTFKLMLQWNASPESHNYFSLQGKVGEVRVLRDEGAASFKRITTQC